MEPSVDGAASGLEHRNESFQPPSSLQKSRKDSSSGSSSSSSFDDSSSSDSSTFALKSGTLLDFLTTPYGLLDQVQGKSRKAQQKLKNFQPSKLSFRLRMTVEDTRTKANLELDKYRPQLYKSLRQVEKQWNDPKTATTLEKIAFIAAVLNVFISGLLLGARPEWFYYWYSAQLFYFMPIRFFAYKKKGYHYFLADLCYFVNLLLILSLFVFPANRPLFISVFCLAFGNNAVAIAMWRNSLVFHSVDKVTSLFIHIMPCVTIHTLLHLIPQSLRESRFPAVAAIASSTHSYSLLQMILYASVPYFFWQLSYHFFITVRRREKIAAGRPTSFTWLRHSYAGTTLGNLVLSLPPSWQEPGFMAIQYSYAVLTMLPCPIWISHSYASAIYLFLFFAWSIVNGSTYYIDVFGERFKKQLEELQAELEMAHEESRRKSDDGAAEMSDHSNGGEDNKSSTESSVRARGNSSGKDSAISSGVQVLTGADGHSQRAFPVNP